MYLNATAYWQNVPQPVWGFTIGGYQVIKKWLSYREQRVLGRALTMAEIMEVTAMARRLAALVLLQAAGCTGCQLRGRGRFNLCIWQSSLKYCAKF